MTQVRQIVAALLIYLACWAASFLYIVGWRPQLAPSYFYLGWSLRGLELVSFVWLLSLLLFAIVLVTIAVRRIRSGRRGVV